MRGVLRWLAAAGLAGGLAGCVTPGPPPAPPLLSMDGRTCGGQVDLAGALPLALKPKDNVAVDATISVGSPCVRTAAGQASAYTVFALPEWPEEYLIAVTSIPAGSALFSPRVQVVDGSGKVVREVTRDRFSFHGTSLHLGLRIHAGERYLVVASDPAIVGQTVMHITSATQANAMSYGTGTVMVYTGSEGSVQLVYAHNGHVAVLAEPMPKADD